MILRHNNFHVHVCWNDRNGNIDRLVGVEFTRDCEVCAVDTDPLEGDRAELVPLSDGPGFVLDGEHAFTLIRTKQHVGNIMWDELLMSREETGRFAEYLQRARHWNRTVAIPEIFDRWGTLSGDEFCKLLDTATDLAR